MASQKQRYAGKLPKLWDLLVQMHEKNPNFFESADMLRYQVAQVWKALSDKDHCPNCKASMAMYRRKIDYFVVSLLVSMARIVEHNKRKGMSFTNANSVHVNADDRIPHNAKNMTGIASALGLIAPDDKEKEARWLITTRGWAALRGERIPAAVVTFRDEIVERPEETTTFAEVMSNSKTTQSKDIYNPREWYEIHGTANSPVL